MAGTVLSLRPLIHSPVQTHPIQTATRTHTNSTRIRIRNPLRPPSSTSSSSSASQQNPNSPNGSKPEHESESPLPALLNRVGYEPNCRKALSLLICLVFNAMFLVCLIGLMGSAWRYCTLLCRQFWHSQPILSLHSWILPLLAIWVC